MRRILPLLLLFALTLLCLAAPAAAADNPPFDPTVCYQFTDGGPLSEQCQQMIAAYPRPPVGATEQDKVTLDSFSFWRVGPDPVPEFDAPGGNQISEIPQGFNFVSAIDLSNPDWIEIEGGKWLRKSDTKFVQPSFFTGVTISNSLEYPFAFVLDKSRIFVSAYPGGPRSQANGRWLKRYELVNIFATATDKDGWHWYMIGPNQWVEQRFVSVVKKIDRPEGVSGRWVAVDLYEQTLVAYEDDTPVFATLVSTGLPHHETNTGLFHVWANVTSDPMSGATGAPSAYALQRVPWVMYFDGGISLHGTYWHDLFGYRQSHGCVNLTISDAHWLYEWFHNGADDVAQLNNPVYVYSSGTYGVTATGI